MHAKNEKISFSKEVEENHYNTDAGMQISYDKWSIIER